MGKKTDVTLKRPYHFWVEIQNFENCTKNQNRFFFLAPLNGARIWFQNMDADVGQATTPSAEARYGKFRPCCPRWFENMLNLLLENYGLAFFFGEAFVFVANKVLGSNI